jgi:membrane dipeptidase
MLLAASAVASGRSVGQTPVAPLGDGAQLKDLGLTLTDEQRAAGSAFLNSHASVDIHSHPGRFFLRDLPFETANTLAFGAPFESRAVEDLEAGNVSAALMAVVADARLLATTATGGLHSGSDFKEGEAYADFKAQLAQLKAMRSRFNLHVGLRPEDVVDAHKTHRPAAVFSVEGGDFIEDRLERIHHAHADGIRAITLVHYHINQIGDIQTESPVHNGLTPLGKSIVREMNHAGVMIDLAHAPFAVCKDAVAASRKPVMVSHTNLATATMSHPRLISTEHAKLIADAGGIIGAWPSGFGLSNFSDYIDAIQRLVDAVGIDHVAIGTDMDANYKPVLSNYRDWPLVPAALLARGMKSDDLAKLMGGNFMRVFRANTA